MGSCAIILITYEPVGGGQCNRRPTKQMVPANAEERENVHEIANQQRRIAGHIVLIVVKDLRKPASHAIFVFVWIFDDFQIYRFGKFSKRNAKKRERERERYTAN